MKLFYLIAALLISGVCFAQKRHGIFIPKDDGSQSSKPTKHMLAGYYNPIAPRNGHFIRVWTNNGFTDSGDFYFSNYLVKPDHKGKIEIHSLQKVWNGKSYDTVLFMDRFNVIEPPSIRITITEDNFRFDSTLRFNLINKTTGKKLGKRYEVGRIYRIKVYDTRDSLVNAFECLGPNISLSSHGPLYCSSLYRHPVHSGYKIVIRLLARDLKTDLLLFVDELSYVLK